MRDEINNYNITNPDGVSLENFDSEKKISFSNDDHRSVAEDSSTQIDEWDRSVSEDLSSAEKTRPKGSDENGGTEGRSANNGDGTGDMQDALLLLRFARGLVPETALDTANADANGDGAVDMQDALFVLRKAMGLV